MLIEIFSGKTSFAFDSLQVAFMSLNERAQTLSVHTAESVTVFGEAPESRGAAFSAKETHPLTYPECVGVYLLWREWLAKQED